MEPGSSSYNASSNNTDARHLSHLFDVTTCQRPDPARTGSRVEDNPSPGMRTRPSERHHQSLSLFREATQPSFCTLHRVSWLGATGSAGNCCPSMSDTEHQFNLEPIAQIIMTPPNCAPVTQTQ